MYYLRTKPAAQAIQFTVDKQKLMKKVEDTNGVNGINGSAEENRDKNMAAISCSLQNKDDCLMCGS